jgi:hypothetical protein
MSDNQNWDDPHRHRQDVHYRLYDTVHNGPAVICVQDFDYFDYDGARFLSSEAWDREADAEAALTRMLAIRDGALMTRAVVAEKLDTGDVVNVLYDRARGTTVVVAYREGQF